jgi:diguanylate cyclase (GGDEF)-like protein/PAS domain S-box-containing protein
MTARIDGRQFLILMTPLVASVIALLVLVVLSLDILSTGRAYVGGEGYWSKAQKDAVLDLMRYARSFESAHYDAYRTALAVPLGDRKAREALDRPDPDYAAAHDGFIEGRNDPADVDGMAHFFVRYRNVSYIDRAIRIWAEGDREIEGLQVAAGRLHEAISSGRRDPAEIERLLAAVRASNQRLAPLEDAFSQTLGEATRVLRDLLVAALVAVGALLVGAAALVMHRIVRRAETAEAAVRESDARLRLVADGVPALISYVDTNQRYCFSNHTYEDWYGIPHDRMIGSTIREVFGDESYANLRPRIERALAGESVRFEHMSREGGRARALQVAYVPRTDGTGRVVGFYVLANDVTELKETQEELRRATRSLSRHIEQLQFIAHHDALTGLPNRVMFEQHAQQLLSRARRHGECAGLLFIDLDGFKAVNDLRGHHMGDEVLRAVASRIGKNVRKEDVSARLGGDEFCVILDSMPDPESVEAAARNLTEIICKPYTIAGQEVAMTASVGISCFPRDGDNVNVLLKRADADMYRAKTQLHSVSGGSLVNRA